jgi:formylmethanofuran dehydrogenase subunit C
MIPNNNIKQHIMITADKDYTILKADGTEVIVQGRNAREALGIFMKRGRFGLGKDWSMTRQKNGWIVVSPTSCKTLERTYYKMRETQYTPHTRQAL